VGCEITLSISTARRPKNGDEGIFGHVNGPPGMSRDVDVWMPFISNAMKDIFGSHKYVSYSR